MESVCPVAFDEDLLLVDRFVGGQRDAFQVLYETYYEKVFVIARGILLDAEEADDATQEIFTLIYKNLPLFDRRSKLSTWIIRIAINRSIQHSRTQKRRANTIPLTDAAESTIVNPQTDIDPRVGEVMAKLSPQDRALLTLFYWEDLTVQELSESVGCTVNAAKTRLFRARERFRKVYEAGI